MRATLPALLMLLSGCGPLMPDLPEALVPDLGLSALWAPAVPEAEPDPPELARLAAASDGTPSLRLAWGKGTALALLVAQNGENRLWRSAGGVVVATDGARIVATAGLREWIASTRIDGPDPLDDPLALAGHSVALRRQVDLMRGNRSPESMRFGVALSCRLSAAKQGPALVVRESCHGGGASAPKGGFTNRYWADPGSGGIYRSEQWVGATGMMRLDVVTPPS